MTTSSPVCRTCLGIISEGKAGYNIDDENGIIKNVRNIREMMLFCVPEMDVYISVGPSICNTCLVTLVNVYNFKIRCMRVEKAIRSYIVTNNVMEGSCVDLSNVVRQQIIEALKQKNWPPDVIRDYISKVDKCLNKPKHNSRLPIPPEVFNTMARNFNVQKSLSNPPGRSSRNVTLPSPNTNICPNTLIESNPALNHLLNSSAAVSTPLSPPSSYEQALRNDSVQKGPHSSTYLSVSKNLMPEQPPNPFMVINPLHSRPVNPVRMTPNLTLRGPPKLPEVPVLPTLENVQNMFLSSLNLMNTNSGDREEAVMITQNDHLTAASGSDRVRNRKNAKSPASGATSTTQASSFNIDNVDLCPITGVLLKAPTKSAVGDLRAVRKYCGPKSKRKDKSTEQQDTVIVVNDDDPPVIRKDDDEVLIMNFDEDENVLQPNVSQPSVLKEVLTCPDPPSPNINPPVILKETVKRKLSPEDTISEILSKQRRLMVKLSHDMSYLHKNKKLIVKLPNHVFNRCRFCKAATLNVKDLNSHYKEHHKICKLCDYKCASKPQLDLHIDIHHQKRLKEVIEQYEKKYDDKIRPCTLCSYIGVSDFDLRDHRLRKHCKANLKGLYPCPFQCGVEHKVPYNVAVHCALRHDNEMRRECPMCNYTADARFSLKNHIKTHSVQNKIICPVCGVSFRSSSILTKHVRKRHRNEEEIPGIVYAPTPGRLGDLRSDADGKITLNFPAPSRPAPTENVAALNTFALPGLAEILYTQTMFEIPEQENDCIIVDDVAQKKPPNKRGKKKRKARSKKKDVSDDSDDCMIVSDKEQEVLTVSDEETTPENSNKKHKTNDSHSDSVIVIGEDNLAQPDEPSRGKKLPDDINTDTSSEVSSAQKLSQSANSDKTSHILTNQTTNCEDVSSEKTISDGSDNQTNEKGSEVSKEEGTSRKDSNVDLEQKVLTVSDEETTPENSNKKRKTNDLHADSVSIIGEDSFAQPDESSRGKKLPDDIDTDRCSEVSSAQKISSQSAYSNKTADILTKQTSNCEDVASGKTISAGSDSQTNEKGSEVSKEEGTSRKDSNLDLEQKVLTVSDEETTLENSIKKRKTNDLHADSVSIIGEDSFAQPDESSRGKKLPDDIDTDTCSEVSSAQNISSQSAGSDSQTNEKGSEVSKEEETSRKDSNLDLEQEVLTVSDEETTPESSKKKRKTNDSDSVIGENSFTHSFAQPDEPSQEKKLPDDIDTDTSSELSSSDILTKQTSNCQDVGSEKPVSDENLSQTKEKRSEVSKEEETSRKDSNLDLEQEVLTVSDEETTPENSNKKRKTSDSHSDSVIVICQNSFTQPGNKLPDDIDTDPCSEVSSAQKTSSQSAYSEKTSDILTKQTSNSEDVSSEKLISDGSVSQTNEKGSGISKEDGTSRKDSNLDLEGVEKTPNTEESNSILVGPEAVKEVRISENILKSGSSSPAADKLICDEGVSQSKHEDGNDGSNENTQKESSTKEVEASKHREKSPVTEETSTSLASNKSACAQITVEKETSSQLNTDPDQATTKSFEISGEIETIINKYSSEEQESANPVICSDSVLIESSDEDSNDCTIINETLENIDGPSKGTDTNIEAEKIKDNSKAVHTETQKQSNSIDTLSETDSQTSESVPHTVQDSDDMIISDAVTTNPEVIQKILDVEQTEKSQEELTKDAAVDKDDGQVSIKDVKIAEDATGKENSQTAVKSVASESNSEQQTNTTTTKQTIELSKEKHLECRETGESNDKTKENLSESDLEPDNFEVKLTEKAEEELAEKVSDILEVDSKMESENIQSTSAVSKYDCQVSMKNGQIDENVLEKNTPSAASENNSENVKDKEIIPAEKSDCNDSSNKKAISKEESSECRKAQDCAEGISKVQVQEELADKVSNNILQANSDMESENIQSTLEDCQASIKNVQRAGNASKDNTQAGVKSVACNETSNKKADECGLYKEESMECSKLTVSKELVPESTIDLKNVTHIQVISDEKRDCNKKDAGESSKDEMTQCKESKKNDGESEDNSSESKIESEISDKSDSNVTINIVLEANVTDKSDNAIEAENSGSDKTKSLECVSTCEDRVDTDTLMKEVSSETRSVRNETAETVCEIVDSPEKPVQTIDNVEVNTDQNVDAKP